MITYNQPIPNGQTVILGSEKVSTYPAIVFSCKTDQVGILYVDFSIDNENWDSTLSYQVAAGINEVHRLTVSKAWYRIRYYNNSGSEQTYFRLQSLIGDFQALSAPLNLKLSQDADAIAVRPSEFKYESTLNRLENTKAWDMFGYNDDIDVGTENIWSTGGEFIPIETAQTLSVVSTSATDADGNTGAHGVVIEGINENWESVIEVVFLNGTTPVITTNQYLGVNRMSVYRAGTDKQNNGTITATAATIQAAIKPGEGTSLQCIFFVQKNYTALIDYISFNAVKIAGGGGSPRVTLKAFVYSFVSNAKYEIFRHVIDTNVENTLSFNLAKPFPIGEKSIIELYATTDVNNTSLTARFSLIETKNLF